MRRSKSAKQSHNPNITVRRSERLADNFKKLPDDLILKILFKIQDDTKTLIRCSTVCKNLHSLVSKIDTVSLKFLCPNEGDDDDDDDDYVLLCSQSHHHIPQVAFPALMKVFANLNFLEIKLCSFPSSSNLHVSRLNCMIGDCDSIHCELIFAIQVGVLSSTRRSRNIPLKLNGKFDTSFAETMMFFLKKMVPHWPKTLKKVVILSANMQGSGSRGKVFIGEEELDNFVDLISTSMVYESWLNWLNNPKNVTYWRKDAQNDEHSWLRENVWILYGLGFPWVKDRVTTDIVVMESVVKELLGAFE
ncbi:hypothetical protein BDE02_19G027000 [Populus trichocarpa]|jgi:hypothetical protein|nr:hypothetical protein BDE02_19G027000 [Populus trichocarpa]